MELLGGDLRGSYILLSLPLLNNLRPDFMGLRVAVRPFGSGWARRGPRVMGCGPNISFWEESV